MTDTQNNGFDLNEFERELESLFEPTASDTEPDDAPEEEEVVEETPGEDETPEGDQEPTSTPEDGEGDAPTAPEASPSSATTVQVNGREFAIDEVNALIEFYDWARANPHQAVAIDSYLKGQAQFVPVEAGRPAPVQTPEEVEAEQEAYEELDPAIRAKLAEIDAIKQDLATVKQERQSQFMGEVEASIERGTESIKTKYGLADEEVAELQAAAAALNVLPGLAQQRGNMTAAVEETLDLAYWSTPKFREREVAKFASQQSEAQKRQAKASSLSGGSGSVPRTPKAPSTNDDRRLGMVAAITQAMNEAQE